MKTFRVMQFNMQFGQVWDDKDPDHAPIRIEHTLAEIRRHEADIILLQEVEHAASPGTRTPFPPHYTFLRASLPSYDSVFALPDPDPRELPFGVGLAIFSRAPIGGFARHVLPSPPIPFVFKGEQKTPTDRLLIGATTSALGRSVNVFNVHLLAFFMLGSSSREHPEQRRRMMQVLAAAQGPSLIGGDFNIRCHQDLAEEFAGIQFKPVPHETITWRRQPYVLDHVFSSPELRCVRHEVVPTPASDHHVLLADFAFV